MAMLSTTENKYCLFPKNISSLPSLNIFDGTHAKEAVLHRLNTNTHFSKAQQKREREHRIKQKQQCYNI